MLDEDGVKIGHTNLGKTQERTRVVWVEDMSGVHGEVFETEEVVTLLG